MLFGKINNGSPFGVIREVFSFSPQLRQFLNNKLPDMKEIYVNQWYINIFINTLIFSINEGSYTLTGV